MGLLIDGYNLLHVSGIFGSERGARGFEQSRVALLNFIAQVVASSELPRTTIVFDASEAPPGLPRLLNHEGLTVRFAAEYDSADALLEELIAADHAPRQLTVVSSDHRVQRAARRRHAQAIDSEIWYAHAVREHFSSTDPLAASEKKPTPPLTDDEVQHWLKEFGN